VSYHLDDFGTRILDPQRCVLQKRSVYFLVRFSFHSSMWSELNCKSLNLFTSTWVGPTCTILLRANLVHLLHLKKHKI